jgi:E3 ubiquitin-protein ligase CHFR
MSQEGDISITVTTPSSPQLSHIVTPPSLKRRASSSFECLEDNSRKRLKEEPGDMSHRPEPNVSESNVKFVDELAQELQCGCCSELVYKPVLVMPCQHFFCGRYGSIFTRFRMHLAHGVSFSCCVLWIRVSIDSITSKDFLFSFVPNCCNAVN